MFALLKKGMNKADERGGGGGRFPGPVIFEGPQL